MDFLKQGNIYVQALAVVLISLFIAGGYGFYRYRQLQPTQPLNPHFVPEKPAYLLNYTRFGKTETVVGLEDFAPFAVWTDWIFFEVRKPLLGVWGYNLRTRERKQLFDLNDFEAELSQLQGKTLPSLVTDLTVIDSKLYISVGGYKAKGGMYEVDLNTFARPVFITQVDGARVVQWRDRFWLINAEGENCWGVVHLSLFDPTARTITPVVNSVSGCNDGDEYVGIDSNNRLLMATHTPDRSDIGGEAGIYTKVFAVPIDTPDRLLTLLDETVMPKDIRQIVFNSENNSLELAGAKNYVYELASQKLKEHDGPMSILEPEYPPETLLPDTLHSMKLPNGYRWETP